jgi:hypothetical protein
MPVFLASMTANTPADSFYFLNEKGSRDNEIYADTWSPGAIRTPGPTRQYSASSETFPTIVQGDACPRASVSARAAPAEVIDHSCRNNRLTYSAT